MSKSIFISCVFEDSHRIDTIKKWAANSRLGDVRITHEVEDKRHLGKAAIKAHIKSKIQGAGIVLVLIGNDTHNHDWIVAEVELANSFNKKLLCVRVPHSTGALPKLLSKFQVISFNPETIARELST